MKVIQQIMDWDDAIYETEKDAHAEYINLNGNSVPSATTILKIINKPALMEWSNWLGLRGTRYKNYMDRASYIGTHVHEIIECRLLKKSYELKDPSTWFLEVREYIENFDKWFSENEIEPIDIEQHMVGDEFGGTCDCYCVLNGKHTILDFKTSKGVYMSMFLQLAAYTVLKEELGDLVEQVGILTVNKKSCYVTLMDRSDVDNYIITFKKALNLFYSNYKLSKVYGWKG